MADPLHEPSGGDPTGEMDDTFTPGSRPDATFPSSPRPDDTFPSNPRPTDPLPFPPGDASPALPLEPGGVVGRYRVERTLGAGGMGQVLLAYDPELDRRIALKLMRAGGTPQQGLEVRLLREAQAMARVSHPNVVAVHDVGLWKGQVFIAMEYIEGGTLSEWLKEKRSVRQVLEVFRQAGAGLAAAHRAGLVHRDFKPDNVLIAKDGSVRVTDFGLARTATALEPPPTPGSAPVLLDQSVTLAGSVMGTPAYMSPEQHQGLPTDARTDQFSFCVALYQALYGERPFAGESLMDLRQTITSGQLRQPPQDARVPDWLRGLVLRGLLVDPSQRFASMDALLAALARDPEDGLSQARRPRARLRALLLGGLATALVAAVAPTQAWRSFEDRAEGLLLVARPRPWSERIVLVTIDQATIRKYGWPLPRHLQARVLEALARAEVRAVAYDGFFTQPAIDGPEADAHFGRALARFGRAVLAVPCTSDAGVEPTRMAAQVAPSSLLPGAAPAFDCEGVLAPVDPLLRGAAGVAQAEIARSASGTVRGAYLLGNVAGEKLPTLALATLAAGEHIPLSSMAQAPGALKVGGLEVPLDDSGAILASFRRPGRGDVLSFGELADAIAVTDPPTLPEALAARLRGRYVLSGQTAETVGDVGSFANGQMLPLVLLHGALLADLLEHRPLREVPLAAQLGAILLLGAFLTTSVLLLRPALTAAALLVVLLGIPGVGLLLARAGIAVGPLAPATASLLAFALGLAGRLTAEEQDRRRVKGAFHTYLNEAALERILRDPGRSLSLEGARKRVTILCANAHSPAGEAERLPPEEAISRRRRRMKVMAERVLEEDGRIEALRGEGLVAVFGDPIPHPDHARRAVAAGLALQRALAGAEPGVEVRVGVATGLALVGNVGPEEEKIEYSVLGEPVELAARLARQARPGTVLIAADARQSCADSFEFEVTEEAGPSGPAYVARAKERRPR